MKLFFANDIQTYVGVAVPTGSTCILTLSQNAVTLVGNVLAQSRYSIPIVAGSLSQEIWFTDELNPSGLGYHIQIQVPNVGIVYDQQNVPITGASFNLASFVPGSQGNATGVVLPTFETNGTANTNQSILNLKSGTGITLSSDSNGGVTITGAAQRVTSVGLVDSTGLFTVTGSPVTSTGNLTLSAFASQTANTFLAAPNGSNGAPTFRGIAAVDVPTLNQNSTGTSGGLTGNPSISVTAITVGVANTTAGVITLEGSTSGAATITAPAVAGTTTNPIVFSNAIMATETLMFNNAAGTAGQIVFVPSGSTYFDYLNTLSFRAISGGLATILNVGTTGVTATGINLSSTTSAYQVNGLPVAAPVLLAPNSSSVTNTQLTSNVATYTCANNFIAGQMVTTTGLSAPYNVTLKPIVSATSSSFTVAITNANIGSAGASGSAWVPTLDVRGNANQAGTAPVYAVSNSAGQPLMWLDQAASSGTDSGNLTLNLQCYASGQSININLTPAGGGGSGYLQVGGTTIMGAYFGTTLFSGSAITFYQSIAGFNSHKFPCASASTVAFDMAENTAAAAAPASGFGRLRWAAGTAGGYKLMASANNSAVESTIADNVGNGRNQSVASLAYVDLTAQTAAVGTTTLYAVPAAGAGQYRLSWNAKVTTAAGVSSTLGPLTITYVDPDGTTQTITCAANSKSGTQETSDTGNSTTTVLLGDPFMINSAASQNITYAFGYASNAANAMNYNLHVRLESM